MSPFFSLAAAVALALVHILSNSLRVLDGIPGSRFQSIAGGMAVAFVILQLLPALSQGQQAVEQAADRVFALLQRHIYILVRLSLIAFFCAGTARQAVSQ